MKSLFSYREVRFMLFVMNWINKLLRGTVPTSERFRAIPQFFSLKFAKWCFKVSVSDIIVWINIQFCNVLRWIKVVRDLSNYQYTILDLSDQSDQPRMVLCETHHVHFILYSFSRNTKTYGSSPTSKWWKSTIPYIKWHAVM